MDEDLEIDKITDLEVLRAMVVTPSIDPDDLESVPPSTRARWWREQQQRRYAAMLRIQHLTNRIDWSDHDQ
jgi:hypothetical protein